ncbi:MAG: hypothetical protein KF824_11475 [Fimbriimonadaceae bacterium]|nr:MAG: hypothetical protein KF824_11475 [Fimbriimonadaceae bacterium]
MKKCRVFSIVTAVLFSANAFAGPNTARILSFEFTKYDSTVPVRTDFALPIRYGEGGILAESPRDSREKAAPRFARGSTLAVIEKNNGEVITAPLIQGGMRGFGITATAVFPSFEIDQVRHIGVKEVEAGSSPAVNDFNGIKVVAITDSGAKLLVRRLPQIQPLGSVMRNGYRAFPQLGTEEALPQVSKFTTVIGFGDGFSDTRAMEIELEDIFGVASPATFVRAPDNRSRQFAAYYPMTMKRELLHKINLHRKYTTYGPGNDDCEVLSLKMEGGDPDLPSVILYDSGRRPFKLADLQSWQSEVFNKRSIPTNLDVKTTILTIFTGSDDLRTESEKVSETSKLILDLTGTPNGASVATLTKNVPDENDLRRGAFRSRTSWTTQFEFGQMTPASKLTVFNLRAIMGQGASFPALLQPDQWTFDGFRIVTYDSRGIQRVLYSHYLSEKIFGERVRAFNFADANNYTQNPYSIVRSGVPINLPGFQSGG